MLAGWRDHVRPRRGRALRATAVIAGLVVVGTLTTAGVVISDKLSGGGRQPESLVPANAFAFVKVDLNPAAAQKIAVWRLVHTFPKAHGRSNSDLFAQFVASGLPRCTDYGHDIRPWLGRRAAFAGVLAGVGNHARTALVAVLQVRDGGLATAGLGRVVTCSHGRVGFVITKGYAVIGAPSAITGIVAAATQGSLGDDATFRADQRALGGNQVAIGWVDGGRVAGVARAIVAAGPTALLGGPLFAPVERAALTELARVPRGRLLIGLHAADHAFEITGTTVGAGLGPSVGRAADLLRAAPGGSMIAFALAGPHRPGADRVLAARLGSILGPAVPLLGVLLGQRLAVTGRPDGLIVGLVPLFGTGAHLGSDAQLGYALGGADVGGAGVTAAGFVRLAPLLHLTGIGSRGGLNAFTAAGVLITVRSGELGFRLRLVVRG